MKSGGECICGSQRRPGVLQTTLHAIPLRQNLSQNRRLPSFDWAHWPGSPSNPPASPSSSITRVTGMDSYAQIFAEALGIWEVLTSSCFLSKHSFPWSHLPIPKCVNILKATKSKVYSIKCTQNSAAMIAHVFIVAQLMSVTLSPGL